MLPNRMDLPTLHLTIELTSWAEEGFYCLTHPSIRVCRRKLASHWKRLPCVDSYFEGGEGPIAQNGDHLFSLFFETLFKHLPFSFNETTPMGRSLGQWPRQASTFLEFNFSLLTPEDEVDCAKKERALLSSSRIELEKMMDRRVDRTIDRENQNVS